MKADRKIASKGLDMNEGAVIKAMAGASEQLKKPKKKKKEKKAKVAQEAGASVNAPNESMDTTTTSIATSGSGGSSGTPAYIPPQAVEGESSESEYDSEDEDTVLDANVSEIRRKTIAIRGENL